MFVRCAFYAFCFVDLLLDELLLLIMIVMMMMMMMMMIKKKGCSWFYPVPFILEMQPLTMFLFAWTISLWSNNFFEMNKVE